MVDSWTAVDFETANNDRGSACAVGLVRVSNGHIVDRYTTLIRPPEAVSHFSRHNIAVHGITAADVAEAPDWAQVHTRIVEFAQGTPLVAHNAAFDMGVLSRACAHTGLAHPEWDYACTLALSRRTWTELPDHKLPTVCAHIGHTLTQHHRADADAEAAARIMIAAMARYGTTSLLELSGASGLKLSHVPAALAPVAFPQPSVAVGAEDRFSRWQRQARTPLPPANPDADPTGPLFGRTVCVSGDLHVLDKTEVWKRVAEAGGHPAKNLTRKTDVLVVGTNDHGGKSSKHRQAEAYIAKGQSIDIIAEDELLRRLGLSRA